MLLAEMQSERKKTAAVIGELKEQLDRKQRQIDGQADQLSTMQRQLNTLQAALLEQRAGDQVLARR